MTIRGRYEMPLYDLVALIEPMRLPGESTYDAAERLITLCALARTGGNQVEASKLTGAHKHIVKRRATWYGVRPVDARGAA